MNVIVDTNVLLSAAFRDRVPERVVLYIATRDDWRWIVTPDILAEYEQILRRPKFGLSEEVLRGWTELLALRTVNLGNPPTFEFARDPKDAPFLAAALAANADLLVTGDADLLALRGQLPTRILTTAEFAAEFEV
jgi:uncharacterized protein